MFAIILKNFIKMLYKKQASLILRVLQNNELNYFVQKRDNVKNASFKFPGIFSLFGGEVEEKEIPEQGFFREMEEEITGLNFGKIDLTYKIYNWKKDLYKIDKEINKRVNGNFNIFRGFGYDDIIPSQALGEDRKKRISYRDFIYNVESDNYFIGTVNLDKIKDIKINEGKSILLPWRVCMCSLFYPTDKLAIVHDITQLKRF